MVGDRTGDFSNMDPLLSRNVTDWTPQRDPYGSSTDEGSRMNPDNLYLNSYDPMNKGMDSMDSAYSYQLQQQQEQEQQQQLLLQQQQQQLQLQQEQYQQYQYKPEQVTYPGKKNLKTPRF